MTMTLKQRVAAFAILVLSTAGVSPIASAAPDAVLICKNFRDDYPGVFEQAYGNLGQCVSFFRTLPVETCQMLKEDDLLAAFGYDTQGECIVDLAQ